MSGPSSDAARRPLMTDFVAKVGGNRWMSFGDR
jgi:hypothetical protein